MTKIVDIARTCHEVNRAYCAAIGDDSQVPWDEAPEWQRDSAIEGVNTVIDDPSITPADLHERWREAKRRDGWAYGPSKRPEQKEHPCMVPYEELPAEQQTKDALFQAVVRSLMPTVRAE